ncbi:MAG TPA: alkaline phosphatase family protein [Acidimicrobiales bacterium]|nr:alkaline phosphatase family protein [Acidimicrobiales bacterium]
MALRDDQPRDAAVLLPDAVLPDFGGACIASLVPALFSRHDGAAPDWLPPSLIDAEQVVLFVVDGLGARQLEERRSLTPVMSAMERSLLTSVAPSTTAAALTSITTGLAPAEHGLLGYRLAERGAVLNVLKWRIGEEDVRERLAPAAYQPHLPFFGRPVPVVSRARFSGSGFTEAHLRGAPLVGWSLASSIAVEVRRLLDAGERFVYAYYDGLDAIAHERGLGAHYDAELAHVDRLVAALQDALPAGAALAISADHGEMEAASPSIDLAPAIGEVPVRHSGEGRFRWLGVAPHEAAGLVGRLRHHLGERAYVARLDELEAVGLFGGPVAPEHRARLGEVAVIARAAVSFLDPDDPSEGRLVGRHGGLSAAEMYVPLLGARR